MNRFWRGLGKTGKLSWTLHDGSFQYQGFSIQFTEPTVLIFSNLFQFMDIDDYLIRHIKARTFKTALGKKALELGSRLFRKWQHNILHWDTTHFFSGLECCGIFCLFFKWIFDYSLFPLCRGPTTPNGAEGSEHTAPMCIIFILDTDTTLVDF